MKHDSGVQLHGASSDGPRLGGTGRHMSHLLPSKSEPEGIGKSNCRLSPGVTILLASCRSGHLPSPARVLDHEAPIWSLERQFPCLLWLTFNVLWTFSPNESGFVPDERDERATVQMYAAHAAKPVKAFFPLVWEMFKGTLWKNCLLFLFFTYTPDVFSGPRVFECDWWGCSLKGRRRGKKKKKNPVIISIFCVICWVCMQVAFFMRFNNN